jgi:hypothetical protein
VGAAVVTGALASFSYAQASRFDDDSAFWTVRYYASGEHCADASDVLEREGTELRIAFYRIR